MRRMLVVIDMQEGAANGGYHRRYLNKRWWQRHADVVAKIQILSNKMATVFQVHTGFRKREFIEVIPELKPLAQKTRVLFKNQDDGSQKLAGFIAQDTHIYLCGMNTDACVLRTARGLRSKRRTVTVVGDACWTVYANKSLTPHHQALNSLRKSGIPVVKTSAVR